MSSVEELERYLAQPQGQLSAFLELLPDLAVIHDGDGRVLCLNTRAAQALGKTVDQVVGRTQEELFSPEVAAIYRGKMRRVFETGESVIGTEEELGDQPLWTESRLIPIKSSDGVVRGVLTLLRNLSLSSMQSVAMREACQRAVLDNFPYLVWLKDAQGRFLTVNQAFGRACGKQPTDVVGLTDLDLWPRELAESYMAGDRQVINHRSQLFVEEVVVDRGATRWFETFKTPVVDRNDCLLGTTGFSRDITERRRMEHELRESREQLRALAAHVEEVREEERVRIAREIHDELGQLLTCMGMDLAFLDKQMVNTDGKAKARIEALGALIKETIQTVRRISSELRPSILDDLGLAAALDWLANDFSERTHIACAVKTPEEIPISTERATTVFRICQEALTNVARHSSAQHVTIQVDVGDGLTLRVCDDGRGISPDEVRRPGSLGLLGMRERASLLGGSMEVWGEASKGTTVVLTLPLRG
jgi:PAS domain S-box-containing protein